MSSPLPSRARRPRLTTLITAGLVTAVVISVLAVLGLVSHYSQQQAERAARQRLQQLSWQMRDTLNRVVQTAISDIKLVRELPQIKQPQRADDARKVLEALQRSSPDYAWIGLSQTDGKVLAATQGTLEGQDVGTRNWFNQGRTRFYASDYHPATLLGKKLPGGADPWRFIDVSGPVTRGDGTTSAVLCIQMNWSWARRLLQSLLPPDTGLSGTDIFVLRPDGSVILGPQGSEETQIRSTSLALAQNGGAGSVRERWADGKTYLTAYALTSHADDTANLGWTVLVRQPEAVALSSATLMQQPILLLGGLLALLTGVLGVVLGRRLLAPLNGLSSAIQHRLAAQDHSAPQPPITQLDSFHEAQVLAQALAELVGKEESHLESLRQLNEKLETTVAQRTREIAGKAMLLERALAQEQSTQMLLQERAAELRAILDNAYDAFIALDPGGVVLDWNRQAENLLGWRRAEVIGQPLAAMVLPPLLRRAYERDMRQLAESGGDAVLNRRIELTLHNRAGQELTVEVALAYVPRSSGHLFIAFLHDISERKSLFASMEAMALRDTLTGLPNRRALLVALTDAIQRANRLRQNCAVFFVDLDRFKQINDRYGHDEGDELLRQFATRLREHVRKTDTVGRLAGDEFVVILENLQDDHAAQETADKLRPALLQPFKLKTTSVTLSASIGIAVHHPDDPHDIETLLGRADRAMYQDKQQGKPQRIRR